MPYEFYGGQGEPETGLPGTHTTEFRIHYNNGGEVDRLFDSYTEAKAFYNSINGTNKALWQWMELLEAHTWKE
jgi:hypothetical protein